MSAQKGYSYKLTRFQIALIEAIDFVTKHPEKYGKITKKELLPAIGIDHTNWAKQIKGERAWSKINEEEIAIYFKQRFNLNPDFFKSEKSVIRFDITELSEEPSSYFNPKNINQLKNENAILKSENEFLKETINALNKAIAERNHVKNADTPENNGKN